MNAQQLKNAILQDLFLPKDNWEEKELKEIVNKQCPISYGIVQQGNHVEGGVPVVRPVDLHCKFVGRDSLKCTSLDISESYSRTVLRGDEILLCVRGTTGILALATKELEGCNVNRGIVPLFFDNNVDRLFIYYQLRTPQIQETIASKTMGSALRQINIKDLRTILLNVPPLAEQKRIVAKVEELLPKVEKYGKAQDELNKLNEELPERLKKSILQEAIEGRLVPQDPNDEPASVLLDKIRKEKVRLVKEGKLKKKDLEERPISEDEIPFEIPESWEWVRLISVISLLSGRDLAPQDYNDSNRGIPYITGASNFERSQLQINRWTDKPITVSHKGDLLITCKGTIGTMAYNNVGDIHIARQVMAINSLFINLDYLKYFLMRQVYELEKMAKSIIPGISREDVLNSFFPLPPLAEQKRIVAKIEELMVKIDAMKK